MEEYQKALIEILGKDAFFSSDFNVTEDVKKLARTVNYFFGQLKIIETMLEADSKTYTSSVESNALDILKGNSR